ncbi:fungal-specific transcription factor domain-containing protein [Jackrogersella minutella]|nr:fungal-specific transcription factor domain-containing protein [Jackrogersella minutella]
MSSEKRARTYDEMSRETSGKDYAVCDQCRIKKIRCGREKPLCSNCTRLGHACEWSGNGKKSNQTTLLSHTIEGLSRRLQNLEDALVETQNTVKRLASGTPTTIDAPTTLQSSHTWPTPEDTTPTNCEVPTFKRPLGHFIRDQDNVQTSERYFYPTSLESLLYNIRDSILKPLVDDGPENQNVRDSVHLAQQKFDIVISREEVIIKNGILPTAPPISILKAMVEPYFSTINPHFPIWTKESFMRNVTPLQETNSSEHDLGRIICSNNLILITLAANSSHPPRPDKSMRSKSARCSSSIDLDLTKGFLANAKRAIEHAELLLSPRLINIQALLSLCIVAQEHMSPVVFTRLFNLTSQCAKSIGLHDWERGAREQEDTRERQCISYCLYILDKTVCWTAGTPPCNPASDVYIETTSKLLEVRTPSNLIAKAKLAEIQEAIYRDVYARGAPARTEEQVRLLIFSLSQRLQDWLNESGIDLEDTYNTDLSSSISGIELSIGFTCTQLLHMWPFRQHPDVNSQTVEISRRCIKQFLRLWRSSTELGHQGILPRIVASYPPLYLYELCTLILVGEEGHDSDVQLLQSFIEMLEGITDLQEEDSYNKRLCEVSSILMDIVTATKTQRKRRKVRHNLSSSSSTLTTHTRRASPYSPSSNMHPNIHDSNRSPSTQDDSQGTASLSSSGFDPLMSPTDSGGCTEDQLATLMAPLEKSAFETFDLLGYSGSQKTIGESLVEKEIWWN